MITQNGIQLMHIEDFQLLCLVKNVENVPEQIPHICLKLKLTIVVILLSYFVC